MKIWYFLLILFVIWLNYKIVTMPEGSGGEEAVINNFTRNNDIYLETVEYLDRNYDDCYLDYCDMDIFFEAGLESISKTESYAAFTYYYRKGFRSGVIYSYDGQKPEFAGCSVLKPLEQENWYYYEQTFDDAET